MKQNLAEHLDKAKYVCTTADIWTANNRSYLGMTVHWIDAVIIQRKSAALTCLRVTGRHTYDIIAASVESIHNKYSISAKVTMTITDNGSNFVKAFNMFAEDQQQDSGNNNTQTLLEQDAESGELTFTIIDEVLARKNELDETEELYVLPPHQRCAAHTMNLIAVNNSEAACNDAAYKKSSAVPWLSAQPYGTRLAEVHKLLI